MRRLPGYPPTQGLYDPSREQDSCGVGFVVDLKGRKSNQILKDAIQVLLNLDHRGACGCEESTGDGAGVLMQVPDSFLRRAAAEGGIELPAEGDYGVGMLFLPRVPGQRTQCKDVVQGIAEEEGLKLLGWRTVPTDNSLVGSQSREVEPVSEQVFLSRPDNVPAGQSFERKLFLVMKQAEHAVAKLGLPEQKLFYISSLSSRTIIYKGMLTPPQLPAYYPDLNESDVETALAMVHSRFSTNTFPSWDLAQPFRYLSHNGEINTLRGNINWMRAREKLFACEHLSPDEIERILPVIVEHGSDSAILDNTLQMLVMGGRSLAHSVMMMIPEAWAKHESMSPEKRDFYEYHACLMEPWDGPASVAFTDGSIIGAVLDRNGLRPSRYYVTRDGKVIMASEVGVLDVAPENVEIKGRLQPGRMFLVNMEEGRIVSDQELKHELAVAQPYGEWLREHLVKIEDLPSRRVIRAPGQPSVFQQQQAFGYSQEDIKIILQPMAEQGKEPIGSMGNDTPLAVLSDRPQLLYNYFKQLFAQVTNPPLDAIREELVTDIGCTIGSEGDLLQPGPTSCQRIKLNSPVLTNEELAKLRYIKHEHFKTARLPMLMPMTRDDGADDGVQLEKALEGLRESAEEAIRDGANILLLTDRCINRTLAPIPALLAVGCVHHHLVRKGLRTRVGLLIESAEPREVHHFALLLGFGATAINPFLTFETIADLHERGVLKEGLKLETAIQNYMKAVNTGVVKVMSKMGISTVQSYRGAQIFEAIGLNQALIDEYFTTTPSRIEGIGLPQIGAEQRARHLRAFPDRPPQVRQLEEGGHYQWRREGEVHQFNPDTVQKLQQSVRTGDFQIFKEYSKMVNDDATKRCTLRGLFTFRSDRDPVPIEEVEPVKDIVRRFATGAMSYGSISKEAHENLAIAMNRIGGMSNTGEGGEDVDRFTPSPNGDSRNSAIKQVASGRFGVTSRYLVNARELQIKMAQGAKPGEGGQLPDHKVYPSIAKVRHSTPFVGLISPPPHHDIYSIEDLAQLIHDLKNANRHARVSVKLVAEVGVGTVAAGVAKARSDVVLISGHDGGTGASPLASIKHAGSPWELGLAEANQVLVLNDLRDRVVLQVDGQLKTGRDVVIGALLGAEEFGFATAALVSSGCIMMRVCHLDTCPVGVATQNPELRKRFIGKPEHVVNFMQFLAQEVREYMAELGFRKLEEMVGQVDLLDVDTAVEHYKARGIDFSQVLSEPQPRRADQVGRKVQEQDHGLERALDQELLKQCADAIESGTSIKLEMPIQNTFRTVGTILGSEVTRRHPEGLPDNTIHIKFNGSAGQSLGAFAPAGITLEVEGDANDYCGKGLSGGRLIVYPPKEANFVAEENIIVGNVVAYGGTSGEFFARGIAGERFCVRNSGVHAVVEGVGDHACEYMTGGCVVVLGQSGRNFAAGMSGGIAFVLDESDTFGNRCNMEMVGLEEVVESEDIVLLKTLIEKHARHTDSPVAKRILEDWDASLPKFRKIMPHAYKRALEQMKKEQDSFEAAD